MQKNHRLTFSFTLILLIISSLFVFQAVSGDTTPEVFPVVAIHISEYTQTHWNNPYWTYFSINRMLEEAFHSDGIPFVEVTDAQIAQGQLLSAGAPQYPIFFSLAAECVSDAQLTQINSYVQAGGFAYVGSSSWTKNADGTPRSNIGLSNQMGITCTNAPPNNWEAVTHVTRQIDSQLTNHIPKNVEINWRLPMSNHTLCTLEPPDTEPHNVWATHVTASNPAQVLLTTDATIMLAQKNSGNGMFIYHSELTPLASYSLYSPVAYEYKMIREAVEWAFENQNLPLAKLSAWPYQYDSAFVVRHDMDIAYDTVRWIVESATAEKDLGVTGQYYIVTGDVREHADSVELISLIQQAYALGADMGSHNGGLPCTPWDPTRPHDDYLYFHWGPDEAMTKMGITEGLDYSNQSIKLSFDDLQNWVGTRPQIWVSPAGQGCWDESYQMLDSLGIKTSGEFTASPYPNFAFSVNSQQETYSNYVVPFSRWITSLGEVCQSVEDMEEKAPNDMQNLVDFYYDNGFLVSPYSHASSASGLTNEFLQAALAKPYMWNTNPLELWNWANQRKQASFTPYYQTSQDGINSIAVTIAGAISPDTCIEVVLPIDNSEVDSMEVLLNGAPTTNYRLTDSGVKVQAGLASTVSVIYASNPTVGWTQTTQADFKAGSLTNLNADAVPGQVTLDYSNIFADEFDSPSYTASHWTVQGGTWTVSDGYYNLDGQSDRFSATYGGDQWQNYFVEAKVRYVSGEYGGEVSARVNSDTGTRYTFLTYPNEDGPNRAALVKFSSWTDDAGVSLGTATIATDTNWHTVRISLLGSQIQCYYDGQKVFDVNDDTYSSGAIGLESFGASNAQFDYVHVGLLPSVGIFVSEAFDAGADFANWEAMLWMADTPTGTTLQFRTRTADTQENLTNAEWSNAYAASGNAITSSAKRWIQYQVIFDTADSDLTPTLFGVTITYSSFAPDGIVRLSVTMDMSATIGEVSYSESAVNLPIESVWTAKDGTVYASSNQALYKCSDYGATWQELRNFSAGLNMVYVDHSGNVYVSTDQQATPEINGLWRSHDNGSTWSRVLEMEPSNSIWGIDENNHGVLFAGIYTEGYTATNASVLRSIDNGVSWSRVYYNATARHVHDVAVDKTTGYIYASVGDKLLPWNIAYVIRSTDNGATWNQIYATGPQILAIEAVSGARLFATDDPTNGAIYRTTDDVQYTEVLNTGEHTYGFWMRTNYLNGRIYASFISGEGTHTGVTKIYTSDDEGATWQIYRTFTDSEPYCGSPLASNFVGGIMYYSVRLNSSWQNGVRVAPDTMGPF